MTCSVKEYTELVCRKPRSSIYEAMRCVEKKNVSILQTVITPSTKIHFDIRLLLQRKAYDADNISDMQGRFIYKSVRCTHCTLHVHKRSSEL